MSPLYHLTYCKPTISNLYIASFMAIVLVEAGLYRLLTVRVVFPLSQPTIGPSPRPYEIFRNIVTF